MLCARVVGSGPAVVLEAGGAGEGTAGNAFGGLVERLAAFTTVLTYDRAGSGNSDGPPHRSIAGAADDLDALIRSLGFATPVVIVGWSNGGLVAEVFAARYPTQVAGLVLLDPAITATESRIPQTIGLASGTAWLGIAGLVGLTGLFSTRAGQDLLRRMAPPDLSQEGLAWLSRVIRDNRRVGLQTAGSVWRTGRHLRETAATLRSTSLPPVPVRVVVPRLRTGMPASSVRQVATAHRALAEQFPQGKLVFADKTGHLIPIDRPDLVVETVRDVLSVDPTIPTPQNT